VKVKDYSDDLTPHWESYPNQKRWYIDGKIRIIEYDNGMKSYWLDRKRHREDGPAFIDNKGNEEWYLNDERIYCETQEEFEKLMKLRAFW